MKAMKGFAVILLGLAFVLATAETAQAQRRYVPYKSLAVLVTQSSTNAPTQVRLTNTANALSSDTLVWARSSTGVYTATLTGQKFTANKTFVWLGNGSGVGGPIKCAVTSDTVITVTTYAIDSVIAVSDGMLTAAPMEIRVYP